MYEETAKRVVWLERSEWTSGGGKVSKVTVRPDHTGPDGLSFYD